MGLRISPAGLFLYFSHLTLINTHASTMEHESHTPCPAAF